MDMIKTYISVKCGRTETIPRRAIASCKIRSNEICDFEGKTYQRKGGKEMSIKEQALKEYSETTCKINGIYASVCLCLIN